MGAERGRTRRAASSAEDLRRAARRDGAWAAVLVVPVVALLLLELLARGPLAAVDGAWAGWIGRVRTPPLVEAGRVLDGLGSYGAAVVKVLTVAVLVVVRRPRAAVVVALVSVLSPLLSTPVKALTALARPPGALVATTGASYPSGHTVAAAALAFGVLLGLRRPGPLGRGWTAVALLVTAVMGISRTVVGAHWLFDAVGGGLSGALTAFAVSASTAGVTGAARTRRTTGPAAGRGGGSGT